MNSPFTAMKALTRAQQQQPGLLHQRKQWLSNSALLSQWSSTRHSASLPSFKLCTETSLETIKTDSISPVTLRAFCVPVHPLSSPGKC